METLLFIFIFAGICGFLNGKRLIHKHTIHYTFQMYDGIALKRILNEKKSTKKPKKA